MEESRCLADRLSCLCTVCITWRRLGLEIGRGHHNKEYGVQALSRLRLTFNDLLDFRTLNHIEEPPVAVGGALSPPGGARPERYPELRSDQVRVKGEPTSASPRRARSEKKGSKHAKKSKEPKSSRKDKDRKRERTRDEEQASEPRASRERTSARVHPEETEAEDTREDRDRVRERHRHSSPGLRETRRSPSTREEEDEGVEEAEEESPGDTGARSARARSPVEPPREREEEPEETERPPGSWVLTPRPLPRAAGRAARPPEPAGPPPGWSGPIPARGSTRRPAAAVGALRRPAAAKPAPRRGRGGDEAEGDPISRFRAGETVVGVDLAPGTLVRGDHILIEEGIYFKQEVQAAGKVLKEELESGERELHLELTGTKSEQLLQFATGHSPAVIRVHLCRDDCPQTRENADLLHTKKLKKLPDEGVKTWETNLIQEKETDLLQADQERWRKSEEEKRREAPSSSSSRAKKRKKKKKKDKRPIAAPDKEKKSPERRKARLGSKLQARKSLEACYGNTSLDPNVKIRKKIARRAKKAVKKAKESSSTSATSTSSEDESGDDSSLLEDRSKVQRLAAHSPGVLAAASIAHMGQFLTQLQPQGGKRNPKEFLP
eukprot:s200_g34.t1